MELVIGSKLCDVFDDDECVCFHDFSPFFPTELLTTCDYHSVGVRAAAYTELSVKVAQTSEVYAEKLVEHLLEKKISHWDNSVRELTGQALRKLAPITFGKSCQK